MSPGEAARLVESAFGGRFRGLRFLRREPGIDTMLATDGAGGSQVVVKALRSSLLPSAAQDRVALAAAVLRGSLSPHLVPPIAVDRCDGILFVAAPFAPGRTLRDHLSKGALDATATLHIAASVLSALRDAHGRGVLHRNVSTANIIVEPEPGLRAMLVDIGVVQRVGAEGSPVHGAAYQSPEQLGLLSGGVAETADLYSLGVVLYECLAGTNPFQAATLAEVLRRHLIVAPPPLRSLGFPVPRAVDAVIQRLLRRHARDRYQSAEAALHDVLQIKAAREAGREDPELVVGLQDRRCTLVDPAFVGREDELAALDEALQHAFDGEAPTVLLEAESGAGKSRLLEELEQRSLQRGAWVLRGQSVDYGTPEPLQMLGGVAVTVAAHVRDRPFLLEGVRRAVGDDRDAVAEVFPQLRALLAEDAPPSSELLRAYRAARGFAALLASLASPREPLVLLLDDVHWAGESDAQMLQQLLAARRPGLLVVGCFRSDEVSQDHWLRLLPARHIRCAPLPPSEMRHLAESMAGPLPAAATAVVTRLSSGNPYMGCAVLRGLVESGTLRHSGGGWSLELEAIDEVQASGMTAAFLAKRIELLPASALKLLTAGALIGKTFDLEFAARLAGQPWPEALEAVEECRRRRLLWNSPESGSCSLVHDKVREEVLSRLDDPQRRALHRAAAQLFEESGQSRPFAIAFHLDAAGEAERGLPFALAAAREARARGAFETALQYYRIAEAGAQNAGAPVRMQIAEALGYVLGIRARYDESIAHFEEAAALAGSPRERGRVRRQLAEILFRKGAQMEAIRVLETQLRQLGYWVPSSGPSYLAAMLRDLGLRGLRRLFPRWLGRARAPDEEELLAIDLFNGLVPPQLIEGAILPLLWALLRGLTLAELHPPSSSLAMAYMHQAAAATLLRWKGRAAGFARRARELARQIGDPHAEAGIAHYHGVLLFWSGQVEEALTIDREVLPVLERLGDVVWARYARGRIGVYLLELGSLREAAATLSALFRPGPVPLDSQTQAFGLEAWSIAAHGRIPGQLVEQARRRCEGLQEQVALARAEGVRLLALGRFADAAAQFAAGDRIAREAALRPEYAGNSAAWLATALRLQLESEAASIGPVRAGLQRRLREALARARAVARRYRPSQPHTLREHGFLLAYEGKLSAARKAFDQSLAVARARRARGEEARTLWRRGKVGVAAGWQGAAEDLRAGAALLQELGVDSWEPRPRGDSGLEPTASLVDRYQQLLAIGRTIASALTVEAVERAAVDSALRLLRSDAASVVPPADAGALAARAFELRAPVVEDGGDDAFSSSLAAPIFVHGAAAGCLVTTSRVRGLFGAEEERLAAFIANLAGAALENAGGFEKVRSAEREIRELTEAAVRGQEDERRRLALAVHDGAGQVLTAIALQLGAIARQAPAALAPRLEETRALAEAVLEDLRGLTHDLRPAVLDRLGLCAALAELVRSVSTEELAVSFRADPPDLQPAPEVAIALFRIAQAAVANAIRHAAAGAISIALEQPDGALRLTVKDNGKGFDPARSTGGGLGLVGMRERATWLGGSFRVVTTPGAGTRIVVEVPQPGVRPST